MDVIRIMTAKRSIGIRFMEDITRYKMGFRSIFSIDNLKKFL